MSRKIFLSLVSLSLLVLLGVGSAQAQIVDRVEANIPFNFQVGEAKLPAGRYFIKMLDDSTLSLMEITSAHGHRAAMFVVRDSIARVRPAEGELIFNHYGDRYFLSKIYEKGDRYGSAVEEPRSERKMEEIGMARDTFIVPCRS